MLKLIASCSIFMMIAGYTVVRDTQTRQKNSNFGTSGTSTTYNFTMSGSTTDMPRPSDSKTAPAGYTSPVIEDPPCVGVDEALFSRLFSGEGDIFTPMGAGYAKVQRAMEDLSQLTKDMSAKKTSIEALDKRIHELIAQRGEARKKYDEAMAKDQEPVQAENETLGLAAIGRELDTGRTEQSATMKSLADETEALEKLRVTHSAKMKEAQDAMNDLKANADKLAKAVAASAGTFDEQCGVTAEEAPKKRGGSHFYSSWGRHKKPKHDEGGESSLEDESDH